MHVCVLRERRMKSRKRKKEKKMQVGEKGNTTQHLRPIIGRRETIIS